MFDLAKEEITYKRKHVKMWKNNVLCLLNQGMCVGDLFLLSYAALICVCTFETAVHGYSEMLFVGVVHGPESRMELGSV